MIKYKNLSSSKEWLGDTETDGKHILYLKYLFEFKDFTNNGEERKKVMEIRTFLKDDLE